MASKDWPNQLQDEEKKHLSFVILRVAYIKGLTILVNNLFILLKQTKRPVICPVKVHMEFHKKIHRKLLWYSLYGISYEIGSDGGQFHMNEPSVP